MTELKQIYRCNVCGNMVEMVRAGKGELVCCNQPMQLITPRTKDEGYEKHVPVVEIGEGKITVRVGATPHPMKEQHYIEWIEILTPDNKVLRQHLKPENEPLAVFDYSGPAEVKARAFCNLHSLWEG